ncbi:MAG: hypothetical protein LBU62_04630 [Bacteroidales bacterium]|jgi:hypothetical protein|nr:hypothetical protein [Bacteroidales bacterium]
MKKVKIIVISSLIGCNLLGQAPEEAYRIPRTEPVPENILEAVKKQTEHEILYYKMIANPEIKKDSFMKNDGYGNIGISPPERILFNPSIYDKGYRMILDVQRWPEKTGKMAFKNFYLVTKIGNRFTDYSGSWIEIGEWISDWIRVPPCQDTLHFDFWSESLPYDERYIVYYEPQTGKVHPIGGAMRLENIRYWDWMPYDTDASSTSMLTAIIRLDRFNIKRDSYGHGISSLVHEPVFRKDSLAADSLGISLPHNWAKDHYNIYFFLKYGLDISEGLPVLVRMPMYKHYLSGELEFSYFKPEWEANCTVHWQEIKYYLHNEPENYEATLPVIRNVPDEEIAKIQKTPYRILLYSSYRVMRNLDCITEDENEK